MGKLLDIPLRNCIQCQRVIPRNTKASESRIATTQYKNALYCGKLCKGIWTSSHSVGENNPNYKGGKSKCTDCSKQLNYRYSVEKRCRECWITSKKETSQINYPSCINCSAKTGDYKSIMCKNCYKGALHKSWKGGISTTYSLIRTMPENRQWIKQCMYRDDYKCQECGSDKKLEVHHIESFAKLVKKNQITSVNEAKNCLELWNIENGMTLCQDCHKLTESYARKL